MMIYKTLNSLAPKLLESLKTNLEAILDGNLTDDEMGLCWNLHALMDKLYIYYDDYDAFGELTHENDGLAYVLVRQGCLDWEHYDGYDPNYPIPEDYSWGKWEKSNLEYRQNLIKHLIGKIEEVLDNDRS